MERRYQKAFPLLRTADCLFVASDYGGEHNEASYQTITFLLADITDVAIWQLERERIRRTLLPDGRRMAFKNLNDRIRRRAMEPFLQSADQLPGLLATFAISKAIDSLFVHEGRLAPFLLDFDVLRDLPCSVAEKLLRVVHLLSLLIAGFSGPGQDLFWATDEDSIAANPTRVRNLIAALVRVSSHYLPHGLRHLRVATSKQDRGDLSLEDLLAIPDIAAGALSAALTSMLGNGGAPFRGLWLPPSESISRKAQLAMNWFSDNTQALRRLVVVIDEVPGTRSLRATGLRFHGSRDSRRALAAGASLLSEHYSDEIVIL